MKTCEIVKQEGRETRDILIPYVNVRENEKEVTVQAEMPGLKKESISLEIEGDVLTIKGVYDEEIPQGYTALYRERVPFEYRRSFTLGNEIDRNKIRGVYENGLLNLTLPKMEKTEPKKILIE